MGEIRSQEVTASWIFFLNSCGELIIYILGNVKYMKEFVSFLWVDYFMAMLEIFSVVLQNTLLHPVVLDRQGTWSWGTQPRYGLFPPRSMYVEY